MSATFPTGVKSFTTKLAGDTVQASHANDLQDEVTAIETALVGGTLPASNGSALTNLNASNLASGTVPDARLSSTVANVDATETVSGAWTFTTSPVFPSGTFTPALKFGGGNTGMTGTFTGGYTKIGTLVWVSIRIVLTAKGSSTGAATITGLPFTSGSYFGGLPVNYIDTLAGSVAGVYAYIGTGTTTITLASMAAGGATSVANMADTSFANTTTLIITGVYQAAS